MLGKVDHTLLKLRGQPGPRSRPCAMKVIANHCASVCISPAVSPRRPSSYWRAACRSVTVWSAFLWRYGHQEQALKLGTVVENGASEVDMVINIGRLKNNSTMTCAMILLPSRPPSADKVPKVIIETRLLTE